MELLRGRALGARLEDGLLPVVDSLRIAIEVAKAVAHAHQHGVVHRDLTPANVFLCDDGRVKVLDFGMAQGFGRRKLDGGTSLYMAPEQLRGAPEDERTDVFPLGVMLYRMLAGVVPFPDARSLDGPARAPALHVDAAVPIGEVGEDQRLVVRPPRFLLLEERSTGPRSDERGVMRCEGRGPSAPRSDQVMSRRTGSSWTGSGHW